MLATALRTFHPLKDSIYIGRWPDKGGWSTVHKPTVSRLFPHYVSKEIVHTDNSVRIFFSIGLTSDLQWEQDIALVMH